MPCRPSTGLRRELNGILPSSRHMLALLPTAGDSVDLVSGGSLSYRGGATAIAELLLES
jgi:hypothetical protein